MALKHRMAVGALLGALFGALGSAYHVYIKVPAVISIRPRLAEVGFWTGIFSGRGTEYLYLHHTEPMVVVSVLIAAGAGVLLSVRFGGIR